MKRYRPDISHSAFESKEQQLEFQSTIVDNISDSVIATDLQFRINYANRAALELFGYHFDELAGKKPDIFNAEPMAATIQQAIYNTVSEGRVYIGESLNKRKDGSTFHCEYKVMPMVDQSGKTTGYVGIQRDISERKRTQDEIRRTRDQYQSLVENIPGVTYRCRCDKDWTMLFLSDIAEAFTGYPASDFIESAVRTFESIIHKEDQAYVSHRIQSAIAENRAWDIEYRICHRDGNILWVNEKGRAVCELDGEVGYLDGFILDISEKKKSEKAIIRAREEAQAANKAKSEFLANMSHEIRTPINAVIGFTDLLRNTPLNTLQKQYLDNANISAHMLLDVVSDILDLSKIESGKLELEPVKTDIVVLAAQVTDILKHKASEKGLELLLNIEPDVPSYAITDAIRLKQVLVNLLGNAVKFTEEGEIELKLEFSKKTKNRGRFRFSVRDTGIGIEKSKHKKLFDAFYQADSSPTRRYSGTGLGLQISKLIVDKMKGTLQVDSEEGKGSTFFFEIETAFEQGEKQDTKDLGEIRRVLVVDDNDRSRMILRQILSNWGIHCTFSKSGLAALQVLAKSKNRFDVVIIDHHMPVLDGLETIRMIRQNLNIPAGQQPVILLYSSADDNRVHNECRKLGVTSKLVKPVKSDELFFHLQHLQNGPSDPEPAEVAEEIADQAPAIGKQPVLLLAEDVPLNMELTRAVIGEIIPGAVILEASTGKEALDMLSRRKPVDMIFMDIQMPVMDGLEAARRIRSEEKKQGGHIPIIALTAGATKKEKEKCLKAGMDDFLAKPLNPVLLKRTLQKYASKYMPVEESLQDQAVAEDEKKRDPGDHFDANEVLDRFQGNQSRLRELLKEALSSIGKYMGQLHKAILTGDDEHIRRYAHSIKGIALHAGFKRLGELAHLAEQSGQGDREKLPGHYQDLSDELLILRELTKPYFDKDANR